MGAYVFDNKIFDEWLNTKSQEILSKVGRETITNEEMIVLVLKAQTNHFNHMDEEFRCEFRKLNEIALDNSRQFTLIDGRFEEIDRRFEEIDRRFEEINRRFELIDKRFEKIDQRFDRMWTFMMWQGGVMLALFSGIYLKLFFT